MLNASHSCMAYLAALAGVEFVDEAIAIPALRQYLERFLSTEAIPTLVEIPGHPARDYAETVFRRFENGNVRDQIARLCIDGTSKFPSFLIPTIDAQLERGGPVDCAALALAGWARYLATVPAAERAPDPHADEAAAAAEDPAAFLELDLVFTPSIRENERFRETFFAATRELAERGALTAMQNLGEPQIA
jgi:mannitol 2-dehydrogenase